MINNACPYCGELIEEINEDFEEFFDEDEYI